MQVAPPDEQGLCSLGVSVDITLAAALHARTLIAEVNPAMPRTGDATTIPVERFDALVEVPGPVAEYRHEPVGQAAEAIALYVARLVPDGATLQIGSGFINNDVRISCFSSITIGEDVAIGPGVAIRDSDNHGTAGGSAAKRADRVVLGDHVWVGMRATLLPGVTIGDGAVVAAGAVVNRDVPPATLVAGVPARVRRTGISWD